MEVQRVLGPERRVSRLEREDQLVQKDKNAHLNTYLGQILVQVGYQWHLAPQLSHLVVDSPQSMEWNFWVKVRPKEVLLQSARDCSTCLKPKSLVRTLSSQQEFSSQPVSRKHGI